MATRPRRAASAAVLSDSEYAFQLQVQEIARASLPSASRGPPASPAKPDVSAARSARESNDQRPKIWSVKRPKQDVDRRVPDQKLAAEMTTVPGKAPLKYHKPDTAAASSSHSARVSECFRIYTKGLLSEEYIREAKVPVVGIGVAVCDSKDKVILEMKTPKIDGSVVISELEAEIQAVVQGLEAALGSGLKRVTFFLSNVCFYYVIGKESRGSSKITALVNRANVLRKKFVQCDPGLLIKGSDVSKLAFKLARDSVVSQISWVDRTGKNPKETCAICFEGTDVCKMFCVDGCLHRYCFSCMKKHVNAKLNDGAALKCPHDSCDSGLAIDSCKKFLGPNLVSIISQRMKEASIPAAERVYCPDPKCSELMSKGEVLEYSKASLSKSVNSRARKCIKCKAHFCIDCRVLWHYSMSCKEYTIRCPDPAPEDVKLKSLANQKLWRQCTNCKHMVELSHGCFHITCRCGHEFCYTCGAERKDKKPTCACPVWDERYLLLGGNQVRR